MNAPHIHLLINHLPIIGLIIGVLVVIFGLFSKKQVVSSVGLWITMIAGFSSYPTMYSGGASEHFLDENEGKYCVSEDLIHEHEEAAEQGSHLPRYLVCRDRQIFITPTLCMAVRVRRQSICPSRD